MRSSSAAPSGPHTRPRDLPVPPKTHDPIMYGKAAAAAPWSHATRTTSADGCCGSSAGAPGRW
nr:hypothetical protein C5F59_02620 [Streptomyces sp. QL37]